MALIVFSLARGLDWLVMHGMNDETRAATSSTCWIRPTWRQRTRNTPPQHDASRAGTLRVPWRISPLTVNGRRHTVDAEVSTPLLYVLRNDPDLQEPRFGATGGSPESVVARVDKGMSTADIARARARRV